MARIGQKYYVFCRFPDMIESLRPNSTDHRFAPLRGEITDDIIKSLCKAQSKLSASALYCYHRDRTLMAVKVVSGVPKGKCLLHGRAISICKEMGLPYRQAMRDFRMVRGKLYPNICGILVSARTAELVEHIRNAKRGILSGDDKIHNWLVSHKVISPKRLLSLRKAHVNKVIVQCLDKMLDS